MNAREVGEKLALVQVEIVAEETGADAREGISSFLEKRAPEYPDRVSAQMPDFYPWWEQPGYE